MLAEFRVKNFKSFKDEQVLSLIAGCEESKGSNSVKIGKYNILKMAAIYGANASGKSNLIQALACMHDIVSNSAGYKPEQPLPVIPFLFDKESRTAPTSFEATFFIEGVRYQYGFTATAEKIHDEWLLAYPHGKAQKWYERRIDKDTSTPEITFNDVFLKGAKNRLWPQVKQNSLFLSVAAQFNHEQLSKVYNWFNTKLHALPKYEVGEQLTAKMLYNAVSNTEPSPFFDLTIDILKKADMGITKLDIEKASIEQLRLPDILPPEIKEKVKKEFKANPPFHITSYHQGSEQEYPLSFEMESDGTKTFFAYIAPLMVSAAHGYTIYRDELESSLHPLLTRELITSVRDIEQEGVAAQLIFSTHDTTLLDPELFGRDQIWFTEKNEFGATKLYSLADYKNVRKGEAMQKGYLSGRYGAIPILERFNLSGTTR